MKRFSKKKINKNKNKNILKVKKIWYLVKKKEKKI